MIKVLHFIALPIMTILRLFEMMVPQWLRIHVPNALTLARLLIAPCLVPVYLYGIWYPDVSFAWTAIAAYAVVCVFDLFDGWLARRWRVESNFGKKWDPIADKIAVLPLLPALWLSGAIGPWLLLPALVIALREIAVDTLRFLKGEQNFPSSPMAKWKTAVQMFSLGFLMGSYESLLPEVWGIGALLISLAAFLTLLTGLDYFARIWRPLDNLVGAVLVRWRVRPTQ